GAAPGARGGAPAGVPPRDGWGGPSPRRAAGPPPGTGPPRVGPSRSRAPWLSGRSRSDSRTATTPIGALIQKIQCQLMPWVTAPPTNGPAATAAPASPP